MKKNIILILIFLLYSNLGFSKKYKGAEIRTNESFLYGRFEVKMKSAAASGMLISFFTFYDNPDFARNWNEIDIEILGRYSNEVQFNSITAGPNGRLPHEKRHVLEYNPHEDFHVYAFEWTPDYIAFFVDGNEVYKQSDEWVKTMNRRQKIMMNIWPSEFWDWTGPWDETKIPLYAMYDVVRYYNYNPSGSEKFTLSWEDNFDKIDYSRWSFASHTFDGNGCVFDQTNAKIKDGYLILALTKTEDKMTDSKVEEIKIEGNSIGKASIATAKWNGNNSIKITFATPVNKVNAKKENFVIEGIEIIKAKFAMDLTNLELITSNLEPNKEYVLTFTPPNQTGKEYVQKIKLVNKVGLD